MTIYNFGSGTLWGTPAGTNQTPLKFGVLQEASIDISATNKELFGSSQFPVAVGRGTAKISGKAKFAQIQGSIMANLFFGLTPTSGQTTTANGESGTIPTTPYQITVANSATWVADLGVIYTATGLPLTRVASAPATGQYSVVAGVYTFAAADTTLAVNISYKYTISSSGQLLTITNPLIGTSPQFSLVLEQLYGTGKSVLTLNACMANKLAIQSKIEDFTIPEFDFSAFADSSNTVGTWNFSDKA